MAVTTSTSRSLDAKRPPSISAVAEGGGSEEPSDLKAEALALSLSRPAKVHAEYRRRPTDEGYVSQARLLGKRSSKDS